MYRPFLSAAVLSAVLCATAQGPTVHQLVLLNEGWFDYVNQVVVIPPSLGSYDPATGNYSEMAVIPNARFGNDVKVENEIIYVSADTLLQKYDANTFALLGQEVVRGIRRIGIWGDQLVITRGEFGGLSHYVEVRDKNTLGLLYTIDAGQIPYHCEAVEVIGDKAYVSMPNGCDWPNYRNLVGVIDLSEQNYEGTIDLGPDGFNPEHLMAWGGDLYSFNNKDYTGSSISRIELGSSSMVNTTNIAFSSGCGTSAAADDKVYYMEYAVDQLARFDLANEVVMDTLTNGLSAYGVMGDPVNDVLYVTTTDFTSTGTLYVTDHDGSVLSSVAIGVAAGKMALDVRLTTGLGTVRVPALSVSPNPASDQVFIGFPGWDGPRNVEVIDALGKVVIRFRSEPSGLVQLDIAGLAPGMYSVRGDGAGTARFTKR
ncbi:MAG: T9SS type A sorting domain-containing protein [Flavobacteriales bacterium]|nr:T9SS type A sorting domain-containing protein [Flavobacteriales bacterium]